MDAISFRYHNQKLGKDDLNSLNSMTEKAKNGNAIVLKPLKQIIGDQLITQKRSGWQTIVDFSTWASLLDLTADPYNSFSEMSVQHVVGGRIRGTFQIEDCIVKR